MWGVGASVGPYVVSFTLSHGQIWNMSYFYVGIIQVILMAGLFASLPLWKKDERVLAEHHQPLKLFDILAIPGAKEVFAVIVVWDQLQVFGQRLIWWQQKA